MKIMIVRFAIITALATALFVPALNAARAEGPFPGVTRPPMPPAKLMSVQK